MWFIQSKVHFDWVQSNEHSLNYMHIWTTGAANRTILLTLEHLAEDSEDSGWTVDEQRTWLKISNNPKIEYLVCYM